jgi:hypothetical protein
VVGYAPIVNVRIAPCAVLGAMSPSRTACDQVTGLRSMAGENTLSLDLVNVPAEWSV